MKIKQFLLKIKIEDKFSLIDKIFSKILLLSICALFIFTILNFMSTNNLSKENLATAYAKKITNYFEIGVFEKENITFISKDDFKKIENNEKYKEVIYYTKNKDLGRLIAKSQKLINDISVDINEQYIEVDIKKYGTNETFFQVVWNKENENEFYVII